MNKEHYGVLRRNHQRIYILLPLTFKLFPVFEPGAMILVHRISVLYETYKLFIEKKDPTLIDPNRGGIRYIYYTPEVYRHLEENDIPFYMMDLAERVGYWDFRIDDYEELLPDINSLKPGVQEVTMVARYEFSLALKAMAKSTAELYPVKPHRRVLPEIIHRKDKGYARVIFDSIPPIPEKTDLTENNEKHPINFKTIANLINEVSLAQTEFRFSVALSPSSVNDEKVWITYGDTTDDSILMKVFKMSIDLFWLLVQKRLLTAESFQALSRDFPVGDRDRCVGLSKEITLHQTIVGIEDGHCASCLTLLNE